MNRVSYTKRYYKGKKHDVREEKTGEASYRGVGANLDPCKLHRQYPIMAARQIRNWSEGIEGFVDRLTRHTRAHSKPQLDCLIGPEGKHCSIYINHVSLHS